jgi:hypothetical protein
MTGIQITKVNAQIKMKEVISPELVYHAAQKRAPSCFLWVALNPGVGLELSPNFQDITIWDKTNANRRIGLNHCEAVSKELRIDILRIPARNSEEPKRDLKHGIYQKFNLL